MHEILLGVNIDHVATLRQARLTRYPDPILAAQLAEEAGADGITLHLREDRRHIQERDVLLLKDILQTRMNLESAINSEMVAFAAKIKPEFCCFVPERREELTTEGGLDVANQLQKIREAIKKLSDLGILVSLFIEADEKQIDAAVACGAPYIEIHTGAYADATSETEQQAQLVKIQKAVKYAKMAGLMVNAGHGLHYHNVQAIAKIPEITELNIGHGIISRAVFVGMKEAVATMKQLLLQARNNHG